MFLRQVGREGKNLDKIVVYICFLSIFFCLALRNARGHGHHFRFVAFQVKLCKDVFTSYLTLFIHLYIAICHLIQRRCQYCVLFGMGLHATNASWNFCIYFPALFPDLAELFHS